MRKGPAARGRLFPQRPTQPSTACTRSMAPVTAARNPTEPAKKAPAAKAAKARLRALYLVIGLALLSLATHYSFATMAI